MKHAAYTSATTDLLWVYNVHDDAALNDRMCNLRIQIKEGDDSCTHLQHLR